MIIYEDASQYTAKTRIIAYVHAKCPGCGGTYGQNCRPNFCLWNSFYTEGLRAIERLKAQGKLDEIKLISQYRG